MPSRKKAKGKARKAAKEAKAKQEEDSRAVGAVTANQRQECAETLEARMERLMISDPSPTMCRHGCPPLSPDNFKICLEFINAFIATFTSQRNFFADAFLTATKATAEEYANVYSSQLDTVVSMLLAYGTQYILEGDNEIGLYASLACYFEELLAVGLHKTKAAPSLSKVVELLSPDDHTLVSYYRKRIQCDCLDEKYKEVKSIKKMGWCFNPSCRQTERQVERSKMFSCTRCSLANYCSVECQRADWKEHREECNEAVKVKAAFNSSKT